MAGRKKNSNSGRVAPLIIAGIGILVLGGVLLPILCSLASRPDDVEWCGSEFSHGSSSITCHDPNVKTMAPLEGIVWEHSAKVASVRAPLSLDLSESGITGLEATAGFPEIGSVDISHTDVRHLDPLSGHASSMYMFTAEGAPLESLEPLALGSIERIDVRRTRIVDLEPLMHMRKLEHLDASNTAVSDLAPLQSLGELSTLGLASTKVVDIGALRKLKALERVDLSHTAIGDFAPLGELPNLKRLKLEGTDLSDLSVLKGLTMLEELDVRGTGVVDLSPLHEMSTLKSINISGTQVDATQIAAFKTELPGCVIWGEPI